MIGFDPSVDRLFSVGDLVDRGPESERVLEWLDKAWFHAICGNHDLMAYSHALGLPSDIDYLQSWGGWLEHLSGPNQQRIGKALAALPDAGNLQPASAISHLDNCPAPVAAAIAFRPNQCRATCPLTRYFDEQESGQGLDQGSRRQRALVQMGSASEMRARLVG